MSDISETDPKKTDKRTALLIATLALGLGFSEIMGDDAKSEAQLRNVEAANLWAFFQARTIRQSQVRSLSELVPLLELSENGRVTAIEQLDRWRLQVERWESDPQSNDGRRELMTRARHAEQERDAAIRRDGLFDGASGSFQLGIVLASVSIVAALPFFMWLGAASGVVGVFLSIAALL